MVDRERRIEFGRLSYKVTELLLRLSLVHTQRPRDKTREREGFTGVKESKRVTSLSLASLEVHLPRLTVSSAWYGRVHNR
jgi:hypothetical protein